MYYDNTMVFLPSTLVIDDYWALMYISKYHGTTIWCQHCTLVPLESIFVRHVFPSRSYLFTGTSGTGGVNPILSGHVCVCVSPKQFVCGCVSVCVCVCVCLCSALPLCVCKGEICLSLPKWMARIKLTAHLSDGEIIGCSALSLSERWQFCRCPARFSKG